MSHLLKLKLLQYLLHLRRKLFPLSVDSTRLGVVAVLVAVDLPDLSVRLAKATIHCRPFSVSGSDMVKIIGNTLMRRAATHVALGHVVPKNRIELFR
jgi:hypothetical protein